jgi:hypothetical protein
MERLSDIKRQEKLAKAFKAVISAGLVAPVFVSAAACGKEQPAVEEVQADEPTTAIIETTPENKETQPLVEEETPPPTEAEEAKPVEWEGVVINPIEGFRFDNGAFFAREDNPYGLEAETKAGVFIKDAFEFNGGMQDSIALRPEVIELFQKTMVEKNHELRFAIPINLKTGSGIKINIFEDVAKNDPSSVYSKVNFLEKCTYLGISGIQDEINLYSPVKSLEKFEVGGNEWGRINFSAFYPDRDVNNTFSFIIYPDKELIENTFWKKIYPVHSSNLLINCSSVELLIKESSGVNSSEGWENNYWLRTTSGGVGFNLAKIIGPLDSEVLEMIEGEGLNGFLPDYQILMQYVVEEYDFDEEKQQYFLKGHVYTGEEILMEESGLKISFLPANE